jgi:hypothetical protein
MVTVCAARRITQMGYFRLSLVKRPSDSWERRKGEIRLNSGLRVLDFSGSSTVTSRNCLLHKGATNSTRSPRFDAEVLTPCRSGVLLAPFDGTLATANFRELLLCTIRHPNFREQCFHALW